MKIIQDTKAVSIKILLAILFIGCLFQMPYGYFQFIRLAAFVGFLFLANNARQKEKHIFLILYFGLAILFQPFYKVHFDRNVWNIIDVIVAVFLILSVIIKPKQNG